MIPKELEERFRKRAMEKYGYSKGVISKALEEAIRLWLGRDDELVSEEESNNRAFESIIGELEERYRGKYVVIAGGKLVSVHESLEEALSAERGRYSHRIVFKVGERHAGRVRLGWRTRPAGGT